MNVPWGFIESEEERLDFYWQGYQEWSLKEEKKQKGFGVLLFLEPKCRRNGVVSQNQKWKR